MHFNSSFTGFTAVALLSQTVLSIDPKFHALFKRQACPQIDAKCSSVGASLTDCLNYVCQSCTSVDPAISKCCTLTTDVDKADCITTNLGSGTSSSLDNAFATTFNNDTGPSATANGVGDSSFTGTAAFPTVTAAFPTGTAAFPTSVGDSSFTGTAAFPTTSAFVYPACSSLGAKIQSCDSATPGFVNYRLWDTQASCFCYQGSSFQPSSFDNYYSSCLAYLSTADFTAYLGITVGTNGAISTPCASVGDVKGTAAATRQGGQIGGGAQNTRTMPSPAASPTGATSSPTTTSSRTAPSPSGSGAGGGGANVAGSGVDGMPLKSAFALFVSFVGLLYLL